MQLDRLGALVCISMTNAKLFLASVFTTVQYRTSQYGTGALRCYSINANKPYKGTGGMSNDDRVNLGLRCL